jgi:hypothetical protein
MSLPVVCWPTFAAIPLLSPTLKPFVQVKKSKRTTSSSSLFFLLSVGLSMYSFSHSLSFSLLSSSPLFFSGL